MSRHSKNNTAHSIFTYHERKKLKGSGTLKTRLAGEALRRFEDCWLCLRPAVKPVCTRGGYIYCRDCLMDSLGAQKEENDRRYREWSCVEQKKAHEAAQLEKQAREAAIRSFLDTNENPSLSTANKDLSLRGKQPCGQVDKAALRAGSFWVAENTPSCGDRPVSSHMAEGSQKTRAEASSSTTHPPSRHLYCPISKKRLRLKEIVTLHPLTHLSDPKGDSTTGANVKWICAISKKEIGYKAALAIVPTGQVILQECLRNGLVDGFVSGKNKKLTDADFVNLVPGGTGFVSHNKVEAKLVRPVME